MGSYDSDSGSDDGLTSTNVVLGFATEEVGDDTITHLGGTPDWIDPATPPSASLVRCKSCNALMVLLLQLDAALPDRFPGHDRRLFLFVCKDKKCRRKEGSFRVLRSIRVEKGAPKVTIERAEAREEEKKKEKKEIVSQVVTQTGLGESLFGGKGLGTAAGANPFGANPFAKAGGAAPVNPFAKKEDVKVDEEVKVLPATFAEKLAINLPEPSVPKKVEVEMEEWPTTGFPKPYRLLYIEAENELLDPEEDTPLPANATMEPMEFEDETPSKSAKATSSTDVGNFESTMDATFQKFADRLAQNPDQVIRYEFMGEPLLYCDSDAVGIMLAGDEDRGVKAKGMPRCSCGALRRFEVQVTPGAIAEVEKDEMSLDGMDWGTVIVGVCGMDCQAYGVEEGMVGYVEEWVGVQWEQLEEK